MKSVVIKLNEDKVINELGKIELENMYEKIDKVYVDKWNMIKTFGGDNFSEKGAYIYSGNIDYQYIVGASIGMKKNFSWLKDYTSLWSIYDMDDDTIEDLKEGLLDA